MFGGVGRTGTATVSGLPRTTGRDLGLVEAVLWVEDCGGAREGACRRGRMEEEDRLNEGWG